MAGPAGYHRECSVWHTCNKGIPFQNISSENLLILQVKSSCHCTVAEWDHNPVEPGKTGVIKISYDAQKEGDFYRIVSVITNFDSMQSIPLALVGKVDKKPEASSGN